MPHVPPREKTISEKTQSRAEGSFQLPVGRSAGLQDMLHSGGEGGRVRGPYRDLSRGQNRDRPRIYLGDDRVHAALRLPAETDPAGDAGGCAGGH